MRTFSLFDICGLVGVNHYTASTKYSKKLIKNKQWDKLNCATKQITGIDEDGNEYIAQVTAIPTFVVTKEEILETFKGFKIMKDHSLLDLLMRILDAPNQNDHPDLKQPDPEHIPVEEIPYIDKLKEEHCKSHKEMTHEAYEYYKKKEEDPNAIVKPTDKHAFARSQTNNCYRALWYDDFTKDGYTLNDDCIVDIKQWFYKYNNEDKNTNMEISKYLYDHGREKELENLIELQKANASFLKEDNHYLRFQELLNYKMLKLKG